MPIGSLQAVLGSRDYKFSFYVVGFLLFFGSIFGRFVCGWLCPFGLVQDLLYKIPLFKKRKKESSHAIAQVMKLAPTMRKINHHLLCNRRGDKDVAAIARYRGIDLND